MSQNNNENTDEIKEKIFTAFSNTASTIGYDEVHGRIIAALLVNEDKLSLQELVDETGYSSSSISLSLDLLEVFGIIKRVKKSGDRKLYIEMDGDLLQALKKAILLRIQNTLTETLQNFGKYRNKLNGMEDDKSENIMESLNTLESEIERLQVYVNKLSDVEIPKEND